MKKFAIVIVLLIICQLSFTQVIVESISDKDTLLERAIEELSKCTNENTNQEESINAQQEYLKCITELYQNDDIQSIREILNNQWLKLKIINNSDMQTIFSGTIRIFFQDDYSLSTKTEFQQLEKFLFNPDFFEYGKQAIFSQIHYSGLGENDPNYVFDLIIRIMNDSNLSEYSRYRALRVLDDKIYINDYDLLYNRPGFQELLYGYADNKNTDFNLRQLAISRLAHSDTPNRNYIDFYLRTLDDPTEVIIHESVLRAAQYYHEPEFTERAIEFLCNLIYNETSKNPKTEYDLFYTASTARSQYGDIHTMLYSISESGTDNAVEFLYNIVKAGLKLELQNNKDNRLYLSRCIELIGRTRNPLAINALIEIHDNNSLIIDGKKDIIKRSAIIGMSYFESEEITEIINQRFKDYIAMYQRISDKRATSRINVIMGDK